MTPLQKKHLEFMRGAEQEPVAWRAGVVFAMTKLKEKNNG